MDTLVIAVLGQKGGTGKTTTSTNMAVAAGLKKKMAVLIDADPQGSAVAWFQDRHEGQERNDPPTQAAHYADIPRMIKNVSEVGADIVLIDTPPHNEENATTAAQAADLIVIPVRPGIADLRATQNTVKLLDLLKETGYDPEVVAVLTQVDNRRKELNQSAVTALQEMGLPVASVSLTMSGKYHDALFHGQGVQEFDPKGKQAEEISNLYAFIIKKARAAKRRRAA